MSRKQICIWFLLVIIFITNQVFERFLNIHINFLFSYLDDLLAVPITLGSYQLLLKIFNPSKCRPLPFIFVIISVIIFSIHFEVIMPVFSKKYTADIADVLMYLVGSVMYLFMFTPVFRKKLMKTSYYEN